MIHVPESESVLYLCSPSVFNLEDMYIRGLHLSDIPVHDPVRDLVLLSEQFVAEYQLAKDLEELTDKLTQTNKALDNEKKMTDK